MLYVLYVLAILSLCGTVFGLKIQTPPQGMAVANQDVAVSWSRQDESDPTSVLFLLENLIGGDKIQGGFSNASDSSHKTTTSMKFPDVGTFRMWAVNPANSTQTYAMSEPFNVTPNNLAAAGVRSSSANVDGSGGTDGAGPPTDLSGSVVSSLSPAPTTSSSSLPASSVASSSSSNKAPMTPLIMGLAAGGGALLLCLLAASAFYLVRRRNKARRAERTTFNRGRMVKSMPPPVFARPPLDSDVESDGEDAGGSRYGNASVKGRGRDMAERGPGVYPFARTA
ncbi:hypothetical protein DFH06DRAFT_1250091 [Mycena polygramma]|nr:hypothetical protein DFH06DRAFT_1250091 [Mycena polygramma]